MMENVLMAGWSEADAMAGWSGPDMAAEDKGWPDAETDGAEAADGAEAIDGAEAVDGANGSMAGEERLTAGESRNDA